MVFETLSGGRFGEDAIFLCHVTLCPHLTLAALSQSPQPHAPMPTWPGPSGTPAPGLGLKGWEGSGAGEGGSNAESKAVGFQS